MNIENLKEILDAGLIIRSQYGSDDHITIDKMYDGTYRFYKMKDFESDVVIEMKDWNEFYLLIKKEIEFIKGE